MGWWIFADYEEDGDVIYDVGVVSVYEVKNKMDIAYYILSWVGCVLCK